jgi:hypothetical protein
VKEAMGKLAVYEKQMLAPPDQQISLNIVGIKPLTAAIAA